MSELLQDGEVLGAFVVLLFVCSMLYARQVGYLIRQWLRK